MVLKPAILGCKGLEKFSGRHPWLFRGDFDRLPLGAENGALIPIAGERGGVLGWGLFSPGSSLCVRLLSWKTEQPDLEKLFEKRIREAENRRRPFLEGSEDAYRLVHGEADGLPGLVVDRYGPVLVLQTLCAGMYRSLEILVKILAAFPGVEALVLRNEAKYLANEGIPREKRLIYGKLPGRIPFAVQTGENRSLVDPFKGQKTGLYLDVRQAPRLIKSLCPGARVLDAFSYTGNFTLHALRWGAADVLALDQSAEALEIAKENLVLNGLPTSGKVTLEECNVFDRLKELDDQKRLFDLLIMDPPPFAPSRKQLEGARRGYKELAVRSLKMTAPGGSLLFFSCSQAFGRETLLETLSAAARDVKRECRITAEYHQPADHPVSLNFPESDYLKGFLLEVQP